MENLEDKSLKELLEIRDKRLLLRIKEHEENLKEFRKSEVKGQFFFPDPYGEPDYVSPERWHKDDYDIRDAVWLIREQGKKLEDLRGFQDVIGKNPNKIKVDEPRIPFVVWVGIGLIILLILKRLF